MNIREDIRQLKTGPRELRKFGLTVGGVVAAFGVLFLLRHKAHYPYFLWPGVALIFFGAALPRVLKYVYIAWMSVAFALGFVMAHIILTVFFFLAFAPVGLLARIFGKDFLRLKLDRQVSSYWIRREHSQKNPSDYERQF